MHNYFSFTLLWIGTVSLPVQNTSDPCTSPTTPELLPGLRLCEQFGGLAVDHNLSNQIIDWWPNNNTISDKVILIDGVPTINPSPSPVKWFRFINCKIKMGAGTRIVVNGNARLSIVDCKIFSKDCSRMWAEIKAEPNAWLDCSGSTLEDGQYALRADDACLFYVSGNTFDKNYMGILIDKKTIPNVIPPNSIQYPWYHIHNNQFVATATLLLKYSGQWPHPESIPYFITIESDGIRQT